MKNVLLSTAPTIKITNLCFSYANKSIFDHFNMVIRPQKITCLLGPSGAGKTTLLRMLAGLIASPSHSSEQSIHCDNGILLNQQIAYLPQQDALLPWLTALDNTLLGSRLRGDCYRELHNQAQLLFNKMGLESSANKLPRELSGGMRQRVALIRTLIENKPVVLMDEPFAALDAITRFEMQNLAYELLKNRTVFLVTHDPLEALRLADDIYILSGQPAKLTLFATLGSNAVRDLGNAEVIKYQASLFAALTKAKDNSL